MGAGNSLACRICQNQNFGEFKVGLGEDLNSATYFSYSEQSILINYPKSGYQYPP